MRLGKSPYMHLAQGEYSGIYIGRFFRIRLMEHTLISVTGRSWLVSIYSGDNKDFILDLFVDFGKTGYIVTYGVLVACRTGADHNDKFIDLSGNDVLEFGVSFSLHSNKMTGKRHYIPHFFRCWNVLLVYETHISSAPFRFYILDRFMRP